MPQHDVLASEDSFGGTSEHIRIHTGARAPRVLWKIHLTQGWLLPFGATLTTSRDVRRIYCKGASSSSCDGVHKCPFVLSSVVQFFELHQRKRWFWQSQEAAQEEPGLPAGGRTCTRRDGSHDASPQARAQLFPTEHQPLFWGEIHYGI